MAVSVGVIGTGNIGTAHAVSLAREVAGSRVVMIFDPNLSAAARVAESLDVRVAPSARDLIEDESVDAVVVASPDDLHAEQALACLDSGKPVLLEKPLASTIEQAQSIIDAEVAGGVRRIMVGFMRRFDPGYLALKQRLDSGRIGDALMVHNVHRNAAAPYGLDSALSLRNSAVHEMDVTRWLLGEEYESVTVTSGKPGPDVPAGQRDPLFVTILSRSGVIVTIEMFISARYGYEVTCQVVGSDGVLDMGDGSFVTCTHQGIRGQDIPELWLGRFGAAYQAELQGWIDHINGVRESSGANAWDGYVAAAVAQASIEALNSEGAVGVNLPNRPSLYE